MRPTIFWNAVVVEEVDEEMDMTVYSTRPGHGPDARLSIGLALGIYTLDSLLSELLDERRVSLLSSQNKKTVRLGT